MTLGGAGAVSSDNGTINGRCFVGKASRKKRMRRMGSGPSASPGMVPTTPPLKESIAPHGSKVSERLVELVRPYLEDSMSRTEYEVLVGLGALAWNLSLLPTEDRQSELRRIGLALNAEPHMQGRTAELVQEFQRRKELLFPSDDRMVLEWEVEDRGCGRYLVLAASLVDGGPEW